MSQVWRKYPVLSNFSKWLHFFLLLFIPHFYCSKAQNKTGKGNEHLF